MKTGVHGNPGFTRLRSSHQEYVRPVSIDHPPLGGRAPAAPFQILRPCTVIDIYNYLSPSPWQPGPLASRTEGERNEAYEPSRSAPGEADPPGQRLRGGKAPASARQVPGFFLKSRPRRAGPSPGARPGDRRRAAPRPARGLCPWAETTRYSCCCNKCKIPLP